ncbi:large ribosomal subunit protein uL15m [Lampetra fluviatilis]
MASKDVGRSALRALRDLPRVSLINLKPNPGSRKRETQRGRGRVHQGGKSGRGHKGQRQRSTRPRLGFEGGQTPFYIVVPKYGYNKDHSLRRQYQPLSLARLQYLIDLGRVDPTQPIDLTQLVNARGLNVSHQEYGVQLVEEGADTFQARVNIEVQTASELAIAAIEKNGGVITTSFYDPRSLEILCRPVLFFMRGQPIPKRMLPPEDLLPGYMSGERRGYLADPAAVAEARLLLARRYGYALPGVSPTAAIVALLAARKDPRQIFYGLAPGWVVSLTERAIYKPTKEELLQYYAS